MLNIYTKDDSGMIEFVGKRDYSTIQEMAECEVDGFTQTAYEAIGDDWYPEKLETVDLMGWPHKMVTWYKANGLGGHIIGVGHNG